MKTLLFVLIVAAAIAALLALPFAVIWALNTLFPVLAIPYTWSTWVATVTLLGALVCANHTSITVTRS